MPEDRQRDIRVIADDTRRTLLHKIKTMADEAVSLGPEALEQLARAYAMLAPTEEKKGTRMVGVGPG